ncbi:MAG TPA: hypothetical protein VKT82_00935 [Ktedonobacterales bacterium]|nr:hypothetical protein [Ktedonobacterales bacterium]
MNGVEDHRQARELAPDGDGSFNAVHFARQLHIHQDHIRRLGQAERQGLFAAGARASDVRRAGIFQPRPQRGAQLFVIFNQ